MHGRNDSLHVLPVPGLFASHLVTAEKNLKALKTIMAGLPSTTRLAFVGDGPERAALQQHFADMPNVKFMVSVDSNIV